MNDSTGPGTLDRRALIKKAAVAAGAVWVAPVVLSSRAGAQTQTCFYQMRPVDPGEPCLGTPPIDDDDCHSVPGLDPGLDILDGCDHPGLDIGVSPESVRVTSTDGCLIYGLHIETEVSCHVVVVPTPVTSVTVTEDSLGEGDIVKIGVAFCCPDGGSISV